MLDLFKIDHPILLAPMAGAMDAELAIAVAKAGGLGALPAGMLNAEQVRAQVTQFRAATGNKPINLNFARAKYRCRAMRVSITGAKSSGSHASSASIRPRRAVTASAID